jgi:hypothetical protein
MLKFIKSITKRKIFIGVTAIVISLALIFSGFEIHDKISPQSDSNLRVGIGEKVITIGDVAYAAGTADYTCDGVDDDVQFQAALNALPANGGKISVLTGNYVFSANVTRAINNVTVEGNGLSSNFTRDGVNAIFVAGGNNWTFRDILLDAGGISLGSTTGWTYENVQISTTYYAYRTDNTIGASSWDIPVGRSATYTIAASDAPAHVKAQADYVCDGTADNVEIQAAIDACPAPAVVYTNMIEGGSSILLTMGTFNIAATIIIDRPAMGIKGMGTAATTLKAITNLNDNIIEFDSTSYADGLYQIYLSDFTIDGNASNQSVSGTGIDFNGCHASYVERIQILYPKFYGFYANGATKPVDYVTFNDCFVVNSGKDAFYTTGAVNQIHINNCYVLLVASTYYGININNSSGVFINNYTYDGGAPGVGSGIFLGSASKVSIKQSHIYGVESGKSGISNSLSSYVTVEDTIIESGSAGTNSLYAISTYAWGNIYDIKLLNNRVSGLWDSSIWCGGGGTPVFNGLQIKNNKLVASTAVSVINLDVAATYPDLQVIGNTGWISSSEVRTAFGTLTAGNANAIFFSWHNPEAQDILIKKVVIEITTPGGTALSVGQVGIADDATGTNLGTEFFPAAGIDLNTAAIYDSWNVADTGQQVKWIFCEDSAAATNGWVVGQILTQNATALVGRYYIEYVGK